MKKVLLVVLFVVCTFQVTLAAQFVDNKYGKKCIKDDYSYAKSEWVTIDVDGDGLEEYYYFNGDGFLVVNQMTPDGYKVNEKGQYVADGAVQTIKKGEIKNEQSNVTNYIISEKKIEETVSNKDVFVDNGDNTEGVQNDPNTIPPKVQSAINYIRKICHEDELIIIPYSKRLVRKRLEYEGYKKDVRNLAIDKCNVNWQNHAVIFAKGYNEMGYNEKMIKELMKIEGFGENDIQYALQHITRVVDSKIYVNPSEYVGLSDDQKMQKLLSIGLSEEGAKDAMVFLSEIQM